MDLSHFDNHLADIQTIIDSCPNPSKRDIGKLLAFQAAILQREGLAMIASAAELDFTRAARRLAMGSELLSRASDSFVRAAKFLPDETAEQVAEAASLERSRVLAELSRLGTPFIIHDDGSIEPCGQDRLAPVAVDRRSF